jgi:hypothetical protein
LSGSLVSGKMIADAGFEPLDTRSNATDRTTSGLLEAIEDARTQPPSKRFGSNHFRCCRSVAHKSKRSAGAYQQSQRHLARFRDTQQNFATNRRACFEAVPAGVA